MHRLSARMTCMSASLGASAVSFSTSDVSLLNYRISHADARAQVERRLDAGMPLLHTLRFCMHALHRHQCMEQQDTALQNRQGTGAGSTQGSSQHGAKVSATALVVPGQPCLPLSSAAQISGCNILGRLLSGLACAMRNVLRLPVCSICNHSSGRCHLKTGQHARMQQCKGQSLCSTSSPPAMAMHPLL